MFSIVLDQAAEEFSPKRRTLTGVFCLVVSIPLILTLLGFLIAFSKIHDVIDRLASRALGGAPTGEDRGEDGRENEGNIPTASRLDLVDHPGTIRPALRHTSPFRRDSSVMRSARAAAPAILRAPTSWRPPNTIARRR